MWMAYRVDIGQFPVYTRPDTGLEKQRRSRRQSTFGRLGGYEDVNDADRLGCDPALRWIVGGARSGEVRLATWDEMDLDAGVWAIPSARMKAKRHHRVPLSGRALSILHDVQRLSDGTGLVFRSLRGKPLSTVTLPRLTRELGIAAVTHGFRSSFRDWAAERTNTPREVVETALAHTVRNPTEAAYARSDLFERRRLLMDDWSRYLAQGTTKDSNPTR